MNKHNTARRRNPTTSPSPSLSLPTLKTWKLDLAAASVAYTDDEGRKADWYSLRMTCATRLAEQGVAPSIAQRILRHADVNITMEHYTHLRADDLHHAVEQAAQGQKTYGGFPAISGGHWAHDPATSRSTHDPSDDVCEGRPAALNPAAEGQEHANEAWWAQQDSNL